MPKLHVVENNITRPIPFKRPAPPIPVGPTCGCCGGEADYEVFGQPHCRKHMLEAIDSETFVEVRRIGGYDDAS